MCLRTSLQQTATQIKFPSTGMDTMPYWNLLPPKRPIKEVLTDIFAKVLEKGWVDSTAPSTSSTPCCTWVVSTGSATA